MFSSFVSYSCFFILCILFIYLYFPYFHKNSLNSMAGLEFKEFHYSHDFFKHEIPCFFRKIIVEKTKPTMISWEKVEIPRLESKEFPRK